MTASISVTLVSAWPDRLEQTLLSLPAGSLADALAVSGQTPDAIDAGIWGKTDAPDTLLSDGDRIELYRPLIADLKAARKKRATEQGYRWRAAHGGLRDRPRRRKTPAASRATCRRCLRAGRLLADKCAALKVLHGLHDFLARVHLPNGP